MGVRLRPMIIALATLCVAASSAAAHESHHRRHSMDNRRPPKWLITLAEEIHAYDEEHHSEEHHNRGARFNSFWHGLQSSPPPHRQLLTAVSTRLRLRNGAGRAAELGSAHRKLVVLKRERRWVRMLLSRLQHGKPEASGYHQPLAALSMRAHLGHHRRNQRRQPEGSEEERYASNPMGDLSKTISSRGSSAAKAVGSAAEELKDKMRGTKGTADVAEHAGDAVDSGEDSYKARDSTDGYAADRNKMDGFESFRVELCMEREDLLHHKKCMEFMSKKCPEETTGNGFCQNFYNIVMGKCQSDRRNGKGEIDHCKYADRMKGFGGAAGAEDGDGDGGYGGGHGGVLEVEAMGPYGAGAPAGAAVDVLPARADPKPQDASISYGTMDAKQGAPAQGFNEFGGKSSELVAHENMKTSTSDWGSETSQADLTKEEMYKKICLEQPNHLYCKLWLKSRERKAPVQEQQGGGDMEDIGWFNHHVVKPVIKEG